MRAPNVWSAKCLGAKCPRPLIFQGANCPYSQMSRSQMSWAPNVQSANCPGAKCPKRQMFGAKCPGAGWRAPFVSLPLGFFNLRQCEILFTNTYQCKCTAFEYLSTNLYGSLWFGLCNKVTSNPLDQFWQMTSWWKEWVLALLPDGVWPWSNTSR